MRADDVAVAVTQYVVMFVSSWSRVNDASGYARDLPERLDRW